MGKKFLASSGLGVPRNMGHALAVATCLEVLSTTLAVLVGMPGIW